MSPLQEKFQVIVPGKIEHEEPWATFESARDLNGQKDTGDTQVMNKVPPGMDITNQDSTEQSQMPFQFSGESDVSSDMYAAKAMKCGYSKLDMKGSDDQYSGEHVDLFYGDSGGFCERNNYLDRI